MSPSDRIKEILKDQHLTQAQFAQQINVKQSTVSAIIGGGKASIDTVIAISEAFDLCLDWLVFGTGPKYRRSDNNINEALSQQSLLEGYVKRDDVEVLMKEKEMTIEILKKSLTDCQDDKETYKKLYLQTQQ